jgi:acetylornithine deacetylase
MLRVLLALTTHLDGHPGGVVYNLRDIFTSGGGFAVPDSCEAWLDVHLPPQAPTAEVITEIEDIIFQQKDADSHLDISLRFDSVHHGYALPEKGRLIQTLKNVYGAQELEWQPNAFPSHSDANQLFSTGVRPVVLGPGRLESAHCPDEWIDFQEVVTAARIYYLTALHLRNGK